MALSGATFSDLGGAVSDLFGSFADKAKAAGDVAEETNYKLAAQYATNEETYTQWSTNIKEAQQTRETTQALGQTAADIAGAGLANSGSALDILRDSASQGAIAKATLGEQGLITEAGYQERAQSYTNMANAAAAAAKAENTASTGSLIAGGLKLAAGAASIFLAPATGGASLIPGSSILGQALGGGGSNS